MAIKMPYMAKRKAKNKKNEAFVTAGGSIPTAMFKDYNAKIQDVGLQKQRAMAAAIQAFLTADTGQILDWFKMANEKYVKPALASGGESDNSQMTPDRAVGADSQTALSNLRNTEGPTPKAQPSPAHGNPKVSRG